MKKNLRNIVINLLVSNQITLEGANVLLKSQKLKQIPAGWFKLLKDGDDF